MVSRGRFWLGGLVALLALLLCPEGSVAALSRYTTIVIDAGHGGFDRGGIPGQRVAEKTVALDVAERLQRILARHGYHTVMTRDRDVFVSLGERVRIANHYRNGIFVCIHFNSARRAGANGIETYFYSGESEALAFNIHRNLVSQVSSDNRGVRRRGYYVLRKTDIPAVLVECGFLTNPTEARLALNPAYRQRLAEGIADGIRGQQVIRPRTTLASSIPNSEDEQQSAALYHVGSSGTTVLETFDAEAAVKSSEKTKSSAHSSKSKHHSHKSSHASRTNRSSRNSSAKKKHSKKKPASESSE